jgi:hypothetical protein
MVNVCCLCCTAAVLEGYWQQIWLLAHIKPTSCAGFKALGSLHHSPNQPQLEALLLALSSVPILQSLQIREIVTKCFCSLFSQGRELRIKSMD